MTESALIRPCLATGVRMHRDEVRERSVLLYPEGALVLNETAANVLELCDGHHTVYEITRVLRTRYSGADLRDDVEQFVRAVAARGLVVDAGS
jgi:pyrroloquinoline quinone biosynthesis protein D